MRHGINVLFRGGGPVPAQAMAVGVDRPAAETIPLTLEVEPPMSARDEAIFLLHTAAEIEHALMVQYLYAAWSLPADTPGRVGRWRRRILQIAREEMAHFISVQNLLRFVGGPLNFDREDFPFRTDFYPFPLRLERLSRAALARYIAAEMPAESEVDPALIAAALELATGGNDGLPVNRVGALYNRLATLFADEQKLPDELFRPDTADLVQAPPGRYRADLGRGPLYLRTVRNRAEALSLLADIATQGEGDEDMPRSHFLTFVDIFDAWPEDDDSAPALAVPTHPASTAVSPAPGNPELAAGQITHPRARAWATVFNHHYRMLLGWLAHALVTPPGRGGGPRLPRRAVPDCRCGRSRRCSCSPTSVSCSPRCRAPTAVPAAPARRSSCPTRLPSRICPPIAGACTGICSARRAPSSTRLPQARVRPRTPPGGGCSLPSPQLKNSSRRRTGHERALVPTAVLQRHHVMGPDRDEQQRGRL
jgi:hypothetical protein